MLAVANLAMIAGSLGAGVLITRGVQVRTLFASLAVLGILSGASLWFPSTPITMALALLCLWLVTTGAATATVMAVLPTVISNPQKGASATGLISQMSALIALTTPSIWLPAAAHNRWMLLIAMVIAAWIGSLALLPMWGERAASTQVLRFQPPGD